ncbi:MAG: EscU/YscU/HrcU family type III secretion system export apparatus switch protein [Armatimonadetes bacterium]|nr:EscU/YscU/HrcU family type III secretion system export apparatus switch protein [Armatimonadota bacterium]
MAEGQAGERTEDATPRRKQEARKKGTVAKSTDLTGALALLAASFLLPPVVTMLGRESFGALVNVVSRAPHDVESHSLMQFGMATGAPLALATIPLFAGLLVIGLMANFGQVGFVLSGEPLSPKLEKINPGAGFKRMFSKRALVEGLKATAKMLIFGWIVYSVVSSDWNRLVGLAWLTPLDASILLGQMLHGILVKIAVVWLIIAAADYFFQFKETEKQLKMTKSELKQEMKEQEGSPEIKGAMMQKRRQLLKGGIAKKIQEADVLITNPTHFAVAVKYERNSMHAPIVLAKGQDFLALKMREIAGAANIPMVENKPLARALYARCEAGDFVPRDLFGPVAEVLAYVFKTVKRARRKI